VYAAAGADGVHLYARRVDDVEARPLAGTEDAVRPFFSPDGLTVGFASGGALRAVRLDGVAASTITTLPADEMVLTVTWASDDAVYFTTTAGRLYRVPAGGGLPTRVPVRDARVRVFTAAALPGGRSLVLTQARAQDTATVEFSVLDLASKGVRVIGRGGVAARYGAGALVYAHWDGALYRRPFDLERLEFTGAPELIARGVRWDESPAFDVSRGGALVYGVGLPLTIANGRLTMTDRTGREERAFPARGPWTPRFSPDGRRLAYGARAPGHVESDVWITDLEAGTTQRVTTLGTDNNDPAWSPDGRTLAYSTYAGAGAKRLFTQALDASAPRPLGSQFSDDAWPSDWSADGALVVFTRSGPPGTRDLWVQPAAGGPARPYLDTPAQEAGARVSPDGRWVAYTSDETGRDEVYLQSFPQPGRKVLVSSGGGSNPVWRRDGRELYYWEQDLLIAVAMTPATPDVAPTPRARAPLFRAAYIRGVHPNYDVSPDGRHVALVQGRMRSDQLVVTLGGLQAPGPSGGPGPR
jgi:hypothetical protein